MWKLLVGIYLFAILLGSVNSYQEEAELPQLTEIQKLKIQNLTQRIELAQLRAQMAQRDFDVARESITQLLQSLEVKGYTLNMETLSYIKNPDPPKDK